MMDKFISFSRAMYSTWFLHLPSRTLFDCGEGAATWLGSRVFAIKQICLSHGHIDHIAGLPMVIYARSAAMGDKHLPLTIIYPEGDPDIRRMMALITASFPNLPFDLIWTGVHAGVTVPCGRQNITTFLTVHDSSRRTLGYQLFETRQKLKPEYQSLSSDEIVELICRGKKGEMTELVPRLVLVYSGDTIPMNLAEYDHADIILHECTFLCRKEQKQLVHSCLPDVLDKIAIPASPKRLILYHFSSRYDAVQIDAAVQDACMGRNLSFEVWVAFNQDLWFVS